jgi:hypothetical protein
MIRLEWSSRFEKSLKKWISKHPESREVGLPENLKGTSKNQLLYDLFLSVA